MTVCGCTVGAGRGRRCAKFAVVPGNWPKRDQSVRVGSARRTVRESAGALAPGVPGRPAGTRCSVLDTLLQLLRFGCSCRAIADTTCAAAMIRSRRDERTPFGVFTRFKRIALDFGDRIVGLVLGRTTGDGSIIELPEAASRQGVLRSTLVIRRVRQIGPVDVDQAVKCFSGGDEALNGG
ncbi:hypothetical protein GCM10010499_16740 [Streptomyces thermoviolaceus subsp. apingens]|nr:hypothetical protein GCM10010499_16740 [Streptomyces thermoviolaceus subsp. apingens]